MTSPWERLMGKHDIGDSRPWDLTEKVPFRETWWFRIFFAVLGIIIIAVLLIIWSP